MINVRPASRGDLGRLAEISVRGWQQGYRELMPAGFLASLSVSQRIERWRDRLEGDASFTLVAEETVEICGFVEFGASRDEGAAASTGEVFALYVDPAMWRRGIGQALWETVRTRMSEIGFREATLWVLEGNVRARWFYEGAGFKLEEGMRKEFRGPDFLLTEVRYRRPL